MAFGDPTFDDEISSALAAGNQGLAQLIQTEKNRFEAVTQLYAKILNPDLASVLQDDLRLAGGGAYANVLPFVLLTYETGAGLRAKRAAVGNPIIIQALETTVAIAGVSAPVGYTVPPGRQCRIDYVSLTFVPVGVPVQALWCRAELQLTPFGFPAQVISRTQLSAGITWMEGEQSIFLSNRLYMNQQDNFSSRLFQEILDPAATGFIGQLSIFGIEVDAAAGFGQFP